MAKVKDKPPQTPPSAIKRVFKVSRKTFFNPAAWLDVDALQTQNNALFNILRSLFVVPAPTHEETFPQAMERLGVKEEELELIQTRYFCYALIFLCLGIGVALFSFYLLFVVVSFTGFLLGIVSASLFFGQAFKFDFWRFQIKQRKLGCTFQEWKQGKLMRKDPPNG